MLSTSIITLPQDKNIGLQIQACNSCPAYCNNPIAESVYHVRTIGVLPHKKSNRENQANPNPSGGWLMKQNIKISI